MKPNQVNRIGVIMYGLLGDVLMRTPIIRELKNHYPNSEIFAFVDPIGSEVLKNNPDISEIIITNRTKKNRLNYYKNKVSTQIKLYSLKLDMIIDLYGGKSANTMVHLSFVKYQLSFKNDKLWSNGTVKYDYDFSSELLSQTKHLSYRLYQILSFLKLDVNSLSTKPFIYSQEKTDAKIKKYIKTFDKVDEKISNVFIISLGSGGLEKLLNMEKNFEVINHIINTTGMTPAIVLNPGQEYLRDDLINNYLDPNNIDYIKLNSLNIEEIVSLMKVCRFIMVPDTGLYHIAVSVGIPIFSVFTFSNPELVKPSTGKYKISFEPTEQLDPFSLPLGTNNISVDTIMEDFDEFYKTL